jgi:hypothetical protein
MSPAIAILPPKLPSGRFDPVLKRPNLVATRVRNLVLPLLAVLATMTLTQPGHASIVVNRTPFPGIISTGEQSFTVPAETPGAIDPNLVVLGTDTDNVSLIENPAVISQIIASLAVVGQPFTASMYVEGVGFVTFSETVGVQVSASINGAVLGTPESFSLALSGTCGSETDLADVNLCHADNTFQAFAGSESLVIPPNASVSQVAFTYEVTQDAQSCTAVTQNSDSFVVTSACIEGYTGITNGVTQGDPDWSASLLVAEPDSVALMAVAVIALLGFTARRNPTEPR